MTDSRFTYRRAAGEVAWQKQLRDQYLDEPSPAGVDLSLKRARVERVSRSIARNIILRYEWLGTMGSSGVFYGIMFGSHCAGVCCLALKGSGTAGPTVARKFGVAQERLVTLARGACVHWAPKGANSKLVSWTCRLASNASLGDLIIAYSDSDAGEIGTIYQACNWTYIGKTHRPAGAEFVSPQGRVLNSQSIGAYARKSGLRFRDYVGLLRQRGWAPQGSNPKGRYVIQIAKKNATLARRIKSMALPYPKRAESIGSDASANHAGEGGANPTSALQNHDGDRQK